MGVFTSAVYVWVDIVYVNDKRVEPATGCRRALAVNALWRSRDTLNMFALLQLV